MAMDLRRRDEEGVVKVMDLETSGAARNSAPARAAISASTGWMRSAKRVMICSNQLRSALPRCD
jgi:hypothetical protein